MYANYTHKKGTFICLIQYCTDEKKKIQTSLTRIKNYRAVTKTCTVPSHSHSLIITSGMKVHI